MILNKTENSQVLPQLSNKQQFQVGRILKEFLGKRYVARAELSQRLGLNISSIAKYAKILVQTGLVREADAEAAEGAGGRHAFLELNPRAALSLVVMLDLHQIRGALVTLRGEVVETYDLPAYFDIEADELVSRIMGIIEHLSQRAKGLLQPLLGIGIGMGGYVDQYNGISHGYRYARHWGTVKLKSLVEERFGIRCSVIHDTNAAVAGEKFFGFGNGVDNFLTVWIADGVSLGMVISGDVYLGTNGFLGEFGHTQAEENGVLCYCGHKGCLETVTNEEYIVRRCRDGLKNGVYSEVLALSDNDPECVTIETVKQAANNGDRFTKMIFEEVASHLGRKLSDIINVLNPGLVTFRGSVIDGNHFLFDNIKRIVLNRSMRNISNTIQLRFSEKDTAIRLRGLASWVVSDYIDSYGDGWA